VNSVLLKSIAIAVLIADLTAVQALPTAGANRPVTVPEDYVITPFGYFHPSCVRQLAEGDVVLKDKSALQHSDGSNETLRSCAHPHYEADGLAVIGNARAEKQPLISHSWIEYASTTTDSSFGSMHAQWTVPQTPTSNDGQTVYVFPGLEDIDDVVTIVQPVLGWNADYPSGWGIASWNCCAQGTVFEAPPQPVHSGDTILGYMFDTCPAGTRSCSKWDIVTKDLRSGKSSELLMSSSQGQTFNWAFAGALEVYNIKQCSDYPSDGNLPESHTISFEELGLFDDKFLRIRNPVWSVSNISDGLTPQCGYGGSLRNEVLLNF
jgi:hypothetical protein